MRETERRLEYGGLGSVCVCADYVFFVSGTESVDGQQANLLGRTGAIYLFCRKRTAIRRLLLSLYNRQQSIGRFVSFFRDRENRPRVRRCQIAGLPQIGYYLSQHTLTVTRNTAKSPHNSASTAFRRHTTPKIIGECGDLVITALGIAMKLTEP